MDKNVTEMIITVFLNKLDIRARQVAAHSASRFSDPLYYKAGYLESMLIQIMRDMPEVAQKVDFWTTELQKIIDESNFIDEVKNNG